MNDLLKEVKCSECGKNMIYNSQSIYKMVIDGKTLYQCGYTCWRKAGGGCGRKHKKKR